jgi:hypothetical protein
VICSVEDAKKSQAFTNTLGVHGILISSRSRLREQREEQQTPGTVSVSMRRKGDDPQLSRMLFAASGTLVKLDTPDAGGGVFPDRPFVPPEFDPASRLTSAWPKFPLAPGTEEVFEDGHLIQRVSANGPVLEVTLVRRGEDHGIPVERTVTQTWEPGRPWWSSVTVRSCTTYKGETFEVLELEGRVTSWPAPDEP